MRRLCWNAIVRNEEARIQRAIDSAAPFIDSYVIHDTGSTDKTVELIKDTFATYKIPGVVTTGEFKDFSQARNDALRSARSYRAVNPFDWLILFDADMELKVIDRSVLDNLPTVGESLDMWQQGGALYYLNRRLLHANSQAVYVTPTHEYLDAPTSGSIPRDKAFFIDHTDGANRPGKFKRDIKLLKGGLKENPNNVRCMYYLAQSYRDAGNHKKAIEWYQRRVAAGGWDEEVWHAQYQMAKEYLADNDAGEFIRNMLLAYNMRPSRAESVYALAQYYRITGKQQLGAIFGALGMQIPRTNDALFVEDYPYTVGCREEFAICGFYTEKKPFAFKMADQLSLENNAYPGSRELARQNLFFYLPKLKEIAPSFDDRLIDFTPEADWTAMNPSVTSSDGAISAIVRTVNYKMDEQGRYITQGKLMGEATADNPIRTRNFLLALNDDLTTADSAEIVPPSDMSCEFPPVMGFEDMRLFYRGDELWASSTVRQIAADGMPEQVLTKFKGSHLTDMRRMLRQPRLCEKNWMPFVRGDTLEFMYHLCHTVDDKGQDVKVTPLGFDYKNLRGGSQVIPYEGGHLCLVHEARYLPNSHKRYYQHRFVFFDATLEKVKVSHPFVFRDKVIEFAAGMCWHPDGKRLIISYGFEDKEARIATIDAADVHKVVFEW